MKAIHKKLVAAFGAVSLALGAAPAAPAYAQDEPATAPRTEENSETPVLSERHQNLQNQARALLPALEERSFLCVELYDITREVAENPKITDHALFSTAYNYAAALCKQREDSIKAPQKPPSYIAYIR